MDQVLSSTNSYDTDCEAAYGTIKDSSGIHYLEVNLVSWDCLEIDLAESKNSEGEDKGHQIHVSENASQLPSLPCRSL